MKSTSNNRIFWLSSVAVHALLLLVLFNSPVGERIFKPAERKLRPDIVRKDEKLADVVDQVRDLAMDRMETQLRLLVEGRERMHTNFNTLNAHYQPFKDTQLKTVQVRFQQAGKTTLNWQARLLEAINATLEGGDEVYEDLRQVYDDNRARIFVGQGEIRRALLLTTEADSPLVASQVALDRLQADAFEAVASSLDAHDKRAHEAAVLKAHAQKIATAKATHQEAADALKEFENPTVEQKERVARLHREYLDQFYRGQWIERTMEKLAEQRSLSVQKAFELQQEVNANQQALVNDLVTRFEKDVAAAPDLSSVDASGKDGDEK